MSAAKPEQELQEHEEAPSTPVTIEVFEPDKPTLENDFVPLNRDDEKLIAFASKQKCLSGLFRSVMTMLIAVVGLILAANGVSFARISSVCVGSVFVAYLIHIWYTFCKAERIFRIYTVAAIPEDWMDMSVAFVNKQHPAVPLQSISEFSAIAGGFGKSALLRVGTISWLSAIFVMAIKIQDKEYGFSKVLSGGLFCQLIGAFGIDTIGTFYLDPYSKLMKSGHYSGVFLCLGTMVGLWMQSVANDQHYVITSIVTGVGAIFFVLFLTYYPYLCKPTAAELANHETVTSISRTILLFETLGLGMAALSFVLFLWFED